MKKSLIEIKIVIVVENEIVITFDPPLALNEALLVYENAPNPTSGNVIGTSYGPNDKVHIHFNRLSQRPVTDYYMAYFTPEGRFEGKIENEDLINALKFKVTLYDIDEINSNATNLTGHSTPGALISLRSYNFFAAATETISKTITNADGTFALSVGGNIAPYKPYHIEAHGKHFSPTHTIIVNKTPQDVELIENGSFQNGISGWLQNPHTVDGVEFTQKEGHGNFKLKEDVNLGDTLTAAQFVAGPQSSRFKASCEIRVLRLNNRPYHTLFFGQIVTGGAPGQQYVRHDIREEDIGVWLPLSLAGSFSNDWQFEKYGFTTDGINEMDVRNVSITEI
jgi:hypothetical protein